MRQNRTGARQPRRMTPDRAGPRGFLVPRRSPRPPPAAAGIVATGGRSAGRTAAGQLPAVPTPLRDVAGKGAFHHRGRQRIGLGSRVPSRMRMKVVITYRTPPHLDEAMKFAAGRCGACMPSPDARIGPP